MPVELICDTNVFYNLGANTLTKAQLTPANETLCYSPITPLELAGKVVEPNAPRETRGG